MESRIHGFSLSATSAFHIYLTWHCMIYLGHTFPPHLRTYTHVFRMWALTSQGAQRTPPSSLSGRCCSLLVESQAEPAHMKRLVSPAQKLGPKFPTISPLSRYGSYCFSTLRLEPKASPVTQLQSQPDLLYPSPFLKSC